MREITNRCYQIILQLELIQVYCNLQASAGAFSKSYIKSWVHEIELSRIRCVNMCIHYSNVIMDMVLSQITSLTIGYSNVYSDADQRKHQSWPLWGEFTGDGWIPRTEGQKRGKCLNLMTSSWLSTLQKESQQYTKWPVSRSSLAWIECNLWIIGEDCDRLWPEESPSA